MSKTKSVTMLKTERGAQDGITVETFQEGKTYPEMEASLADVFIDMKSAKPASKKVDTAKTAKKDVVQENNTEPEKGKTLLDKAKDLVK